MTKGSKITLVIAILALIVAIIAVWPSPVGQIDLAQATPGTQLPIEQYVPAVLYNGGIYSTLPIQTTSTLTAGDVTIGTSGTNISKVIASTCNLVPDSTDILPFGTLKTANCSVSGVVYGDKVFMELNASNTASVFIKGASASSTAGIITVQLYNATTTASAISVVGSSTPVLIIR